MYEEVTFHAEAWSMKKRRHARPRGVLNLTRWTARHREGEKA
jgi:hypothetical protein